MVNKFCCSDVRQQPQDRAGKVRGLFRSSSLYIQICALNVTARVSEMERIRKRDGILSLQGGMVKEIFTLITLE